MGNFVSKMKDINPCLGDSSKQRKIDDKKIQKGNLNLSIFSAYCDR